MENILIDKQSEKVVGSPGHWKQSYWDLLSANFLPGEIPRFWGGTRGLDSPQDVFNIFQLQSAVQHFSVVCHRLKPTKSQWKAYGLQKRQGSISRKGSSSVLVSTSLTSFSCETSCVSRV